MSAAMTDGMMSINTSAAPSEPGQRQHAGTEKHRDRQREGERETDTVTRTETEGSKEKRG